MLNRREFLALLTAAIGSPALALGRSLTEPTRIDNWQHTYDRVFLGGGFWANPMEDWYVRDGWATCINAGGQRNIQSLLYQLTDPGKPFTMSVEVDRPEGLKEDGGAGFRIGVQADIDDHRAACFEGGGIAARLTGNQLALGKAVTRLEGDVPSHVVLMLVGQPTGEKTTLTLSAVDPTSGKVLGTATGTFERNQLTGNIALVSQHARPEKRVDAPGYRFRDWQLSGDAFTHFPDRAFGPILWSMYSLSDNRDDDGFVLKLTALLAPMGAEDNHTVELLVTEGDAYRRSYEAQVDTDSWTATFRIPNWDATRRRDFQVRYREQNRLGKARLERWVGSIRPNPEGRPLRIGALTCQNAVGFPYQPVADNLVRLDPDLLYFSGDQLYENHGGFGVIRGPAEPAILNYLRKFYMFGWSFREAMRHAPTICLPDDHDVFQGNIWGEGGAPMQGRNTSSAGGYIQPPRMINGVHRTNCSHHPDFASPRPCKQDISVYFGDMVYGGVGFAIIADRQWKSGPEKSGNTGGRIDHVTKKDADVAAFDKPGLELLGERQEAFLKQWSDDWRGHTMKVVLSQTVFAGVATHHGRYNGYLVADLDSGGWPQTPRNRAIDLLRPSMALHICGDQHLASLVQYGVDRQRDSNWAFCTPAITVGYQRWWRPDELGMDHEHRPAHNLPNTGQYTDGLGNKAYVYAVANPGENFKQGGGDRYDFAHRKNSGFGMVTIDAEAKTYTLDCYRFQCDASDGKADNQFPGWPVTLHQAENRGENRLDA